VVPARHGEYGEHSRRVMDILAQITPAMEQISIDEAFLDITGCERLWGTPEATARLIRRRVWEEEGLPVSLGGASNKLVAKIACSRGKPHGLVVVPQGKEAAYLAELPITALWGVGEVTAKHLRGLGIETIGDLAAWEESALVRRFGEGGHGLYQHAHGQDTSRVQATGERQSISHEITFAHDTSDAEVLRRTLLDMSDRVGAGLRREGVVGQPVRIKMRYGDFTTVTRQVTLDRPTDQTQIIYARAEELWRRHWAAPSPLRLIGLGVAGLLDGAGYQLDLFDAADRRAIRLNRALDEIRARFGRQAIQRASLPAGRGRVPRPPPIPSRSPNPSRTPTRTSRPPGGGLEQRQLVSRRRPSRRT
jgi:DNA polymerase-4